MADSKIRVCRDDDMKLNEICEVYSGYALKAFNDAEDGFPVIKIGNIFMDGTLNLEECQYTTDGVNEKYYSQRGDIYIALSGATTGKIGIMDASEKYVINQRVGIVRQKSDDIPQEYIKYFLLRQTDRILQEAAGCAQPNISPRQIAEYVVPDTSQEKMQEICEVLDRIKKIIDSRKVQISALDNLIKARFVEMFGDVIHNSKKWQVCLFAEITSSRLGKMLDAKQQTGRNSYPYLANFNVQWFRFNLENLNKMDFDEKDRAEFELREGDLLVCEGGEIGRCAVWHNELQPCFFQKALHRVRCNHQIILPDYLAWWFRYNCDYGGFSALAGAKATIAHLPGAKLKQLQVAVPPMELQEQFAVFVAQTDKSKVAVRKY